MGNFFDEYKSLDRLCKDILGSENGVSEYIERMEREERGKMIVADWERDYKKLKSMRYLRNRIAHEDGVSESDVCDPSDTSWIMQFQDRIMAEEDPLTVLYKYDETQAPEAPAKKKKKREDPFPEYPEIDESPKKPKRPSGEDCSNAEQRRKTPQKPKKKVEDKKREENSERESTVLKPHLDFFNILAGVLLLIGVVAAVIVSCI